jgi:hypothetical protein
MVLHVKSTAKRKLSHIFGSSPKVHMCSSMPPFFSPITLMNNKN